MVNFRPKISFNQLLFFQIYGESLRPDVPYKTLLLSVRDNALSVVREMLDKYGLYKEDPNNYCLIQVLIDEYHVAYGLVLLLFVCV